MCERSQDLRGSVAKFTIIREETASDTTNRIYKENS